MSEDNEIHRTLGRIESKLETFMADHATMKEDIDDMKSRQNKWIGMFAVLGIGWVWLGKHIPTPWG